MTVIRHKLDRAIACTCGSAAVIDRRQHADDCLRGLWRDFTDEVDALSTTTEGAVSRIDAALKIIEGERATDGNLQMGRAKAAQVIELLRSAGGQ